MENKVKHFEEQIDSLKTAWPGSVICLRRRAIVELGGMREARRKLASVLDFSHAWMLDPATDCIVIGRLPEDTISPFRLMKVIEESLAQNLASDPTYLKKKEAKRSGVDFLKINANMSGG